MFKRHQREEAGQEKTTRQLAHEVSNLIEPLLGLHVSRNAAWLADACSNAAERGLGALYCLLFLTDTAGLLAGQRPSSTERVRSLGRLNERLGLDLTTIRFRGTDRPALAEALDDGHARSVKGIGDALPLVSEVDDLADAQRRLGIAEVWIAPLHWDGQAAGALVLFMPANSTVKLDEAEMLGRHAAVALNNTRDMETGRKWGELDTVRWVYDEQRFLNELRAEIRRAERHGRPLSVLFLRIQNLADLHTRYGKFLTEGLLRQLGTQFAEAIRDTDFLGAYREDGFGTILVEANEKGATIARERLLASLASINLADASLPHLRLDLVCATATLGPDGKTAESLIEGAEVRLNEEAKRDREAA